MKIAITGKGGVGKTTFAATLARLYAEEGRTVLAADVDPDANLGLALGFPEEILDSIIPISKMRKLIEERTGAGPDNAMYTLNPKVDDIPDTYSKTYNGVKLLTLGTVETGGGRLCLPRACDVKADLKLLKPPEPGCGHHGYGGGPGASGPGHLPGHGAVRGGHRTGSQKRADLQERQAPGPGPGSETGARGSQQGAGTGG